ncbi:FAD-binding oxidoreductase [Conexibacter sp. SYSU D00693]|uniref:FAD-binding oxidoreductase n=1 Tax=Conexibacter sp. SYSU D00693 TaxID=2812560 RepID=UPI00196A7AAB|nr:FAD-binding oxidoreductase [Conexibacter sp. SYSU D00693]
MLHTTTAVGEAEALRARLTGRVVTPADADWDVARMGWNLAADQRPAAVAVPATVQDVVEVVRHAAEAGMRVAPQGTGHNATAHGALDATILLKTHELRGVSIDPVLRRARVHAGDLWEDVTGPASQYGLAPISGSSPDVGVVGFALGGGIGWLSRKFGLCADSVLSIECVLADGRHVRCDAHTNSDLFWALRGGSGSFAIVTALELELFEVGEMVSMGAMLWPWERAADVMEAWRQWTQDAPDEVTTSIRLMQLPPLPELPDFLRGRQLVIIDGAVVGSPEDAERILAPLRALDPEIDLWGMQPPAGLSRVHMDPEDPMPGLSDHLMLRELDAQAIKDLVAVAGPGSGSPLVMMEIRQLGGALGRRRDGAGALGGLDARYLTFAAGLPIDADVVCALRGGFGRVRNVLSRVATDGHYLNFQEHARDPRHAYEAGTYARLQAVKAAYDPQDLIRANHAVALPEA